MTFLYVNVSSRSGACLKRGLKFILIYGPSISCWKNVWLGEILLCRRFPEIYRFVHNRNILGSHITFIRVRVVFKFRGGACTLSLWKVFIKPYFFGVRG